MARVPEKSERLIRLVHRRVAEADIRAGRTPQPDDLAQAERTRQDIARARAHVARSGAARAGGRGRGLSQAATSARAVAASTSPASSSPPSAEPSSGSTACSGWGMSPTTFPSALQTPATSPTAPGRVVAVVAEDDPAGFLELRHERLVRVPGALAALDRDREHLPLFAAGR